MYSGGEDCSARIWDLKMRNLSCQRAFQANAPVNAACLHPNQQVGAAVQLKALEKFDSRFSSDVSSRASEL